MRALVGIVLLLAALTGCGDGDDDAEVKACSDLVGETVDDDFKGCTEDGELEPVSGAYDCVDGGQLKIVGDDQGWAFVDEEFHEGSAADALNDCYGVSDELDPTEATEEPSEEPTDEPTDDPTGVTDATDGPTDEPSGEPTAGNACADVWVLGATLPAGYDGCKEGRKEVPAVLFECKDGSQLTGYDDRFYALVGGEIMSSSDEEAYADAFTECIG